MVKASIANIDLTKQSSSIESVNTPRNPINNIPETPNLPQKDIDSK